MRAGKLFAFAVFVLDDSVFVGFLNIVICSKQFVAIFCKFYLGWDCGVGMDFLVNVLLPSDFA